MIQIADGIINQYDNFILHLGNQFKLGQLQSKGNHPALPAGTVIPQRFAVAEHVVRSGQRHGALHILLHGTLQFIQKTPRLQSVGRMTGDYRQILKFGTDCRQNQPDFLLKQTQKFHSFTDNVRSVICQN